MSKLEELEEQIKEARSKLGVLEYQKKLLLNDGDPRMEQLQHLAVETGKSDSGWYAERCDYEVHPAGEDPRGPVLRVEIVYEHPDDRGGCMHEEYEFFIKGGRLMEDDDDCGDINNIEECEKNIKETLTYSY